MPAGDVVNRGVAVWKGKVYVATLDGRLVALDAANGKPVWSVVTVDPSKPYTITMAPRIIKDKVMIGNSGSEYGVRGYVSAFDADSGKLIWRFFTVPGDRAKPFESKAMEMASKTWTGDWWKFGGGASPWDSMSYDPKSNLLYFGTGNGVPWDEKARSPKGGDNLFASSIVAVNADTGAYVWHFQTTPGDSWDFDSTQTLTLADLTIGGRPRRVIMQASKNGFFYVIDRKTGKLISANNYVPVTWAKGIDQATGRPIEAGDAHYVKAPTVQFPSSFGGHNWQPMSFSPKTGLVYIPAQEVPGAYGTDTRFGYEPGQWNTATDTGLNTLPADAKARAAMKNAFRGELIAWDPAAQKEVWRATHKGPWNGGTLATGGGLVFQGTADGHFNAYDAKTGRPLWSTETYTATLAGPMTYTVDGEQYVAVGAGFGSVFYLVAGFAVDTMGTPDNGRILVYKLGGAGDTSQTRPDPDRLSETPCHHGARDRGRGRPRQLQPLLPGLPRLQRHRRRGDPRSALQPPDRRRRGLQGRGARRIAQERRHGQLRAGAKRGRCRGDPRLCHHRGQRGLCRGSDSGPRRRGGEVTRDVRTTGRGCARR